jgi:hypothetical protein
MEAAAVRREQEHRALMATAAYWAAVMINAGTMGRKKPIQPKELLPREGESTAPKKPTRRQLRAAEVKRWRDLLAMAEETPGLLKDEPELIEQAHRRLRELKAPDKPSR